MRRYIHLFAALWLAACGGGSSTGGGTADSPFVGTYSGVSAVQVLARGGTGSASETISIYVNRDGLVQIGDDGSIIYASTPLRDDAISISNDAGVLVASNCSGTVTLSGGFSSTGGLPVFEGEWRSRDLICSGTEGEIRGSIAAKRIAASARASRVFETSSPAMLEAFRDAAGRAREQD